MRPVRLTGCRRTSDVKRPASSSRRGTPQLAKIFASEVALYCARNRPPCRIIAIADCWPFCARLSWSSMNAFDLHQLGQRPDLAHLDFHHELGSTNDRAIELVKAGHAKFPLLVLAQHQSAGRGQGNHQWHSSSGSLTFSYALRSRDLQRRSAPTTTARTPPTDIGSVADSQTRLPLIAAMAICHTIEHFVDDALVQIKWPNDCLIDRRKVAGILVENIHSPFNQTLSHAHAPAVQDPTFNRAVHVLGIGVNVNNAASELEAIVQPPSASGLPTSIAQRLGGPVSIHQFLIQLLDQLTFEIQQNEQTPSDWLARCQARLNGIDQQVEFQLPTGILKTGICRGLGPWGELILETDAGHERFTSGRLMRNALASDSDSR